MAKRLPYLAPCAKTVAMTTRRSNLVPMAARPYADGASWTNAVVATYGRSLTDANVSSLTATVPAPKHRSVMARIFGGK